MSGDSATGPMRLDTTAADFDAAFATLLADRAETTTGAEEVAAGIIAAVRARGDAAIAEYTARFDRLSLTPAGFRVTEAEIAAADAATPPALAAALDMAAARIAAFHRAQMPSDLATRDAQGVHLGMRWGAIDSVGIYVPGGKAAYPSSV
nr:histidinol dehydrogenase [Acetobacteraceae bacterium]